eukprot:CAMPEP_0198469754 /NCGR_PEP_ID=MMETSP1456-20131121/14557_1 /TAXON_ID=1461544 ORGANISM="Unidentified sp., Strain RCC1871" /NCGR_SAMPLE_ID=MMETSP1456 /ASSEMBLY_ACC=CAM_ASM_001119 /LENGTH=362 /DNA_ID=CAMNT_0044196191 /DNA_START=102 /DNA_END=1188 /DNA_ORIENTATION=-
MKKLRWGQSILTGGVHGPECLLGLNGAVLRRPPEPEHGLLDCPVAPPVQHHVRVARLPLLPVLKNVSQKELRPREHLVLALNISSVVNRPTQPKHSLLDVVCAGDSRQLHAPSAVEGLAQHGLAELGAKPRPSFPQMDQIKRRGLQVVPALRVLLLPKVLADLQVLLPHARTGVARPKPGAPGHTNLCGYRSHHKSCARVSPLRAARDQLGQLARQVRSVPAHQLLQPGWLLVQASLAASDRAVHKPVCHLNWQLEGVFQKALRRGVQQRRAPRTARLGHREQIVEPSFTPDTAASEDEGPDQANQVGGQAAHGAEENPVLAALGTRDKNRDDDGKDRPASTKVASASSATDARHVVAVAMP